MPISWNSARLATLSPAGQNLGHARHNGPQAFGVPGKLAREEFLDLASSADFILTHHEWWNGQGYPPGLKEEEIPLECRILAIADAYDAITNDRPYRRVMSHQDALAEIRKYSGSQFDPRLVEEFFADPGMFEEILRDRPAGRQRFGPKAVYGGR